MDEVVLIFPHQLFENNILLKKDRVIFLVEEYLFFKQYKFHKQKLTLHRASMKFYEDYLKSKGFEVRYIESKNELSDIRNLIPYLKKLNCKKIYFFEVVDNWLEKRIKLNCKKYGIEINETSSPSFINSKEELKNDFGNKRKFFQTSFYIKQRKKLNILIDDKGSPLGGKWSFDKLNRKKIPKNHTLPEIKFPLLDKYYDEAIEYVEKNFTNNYGEINKNFIYPKNAQESKKWLKNFLEERLFNFGEFQDAILSNESILYHSLISPLLNIGLLTPKYVLEETIKYYKNQNLPLNSVEGFIRQIIGWREFIRGVYEFSGSYQRTKNFWQFNKKLPKFFWDGTTGIDPVDITIKKVLKTGYCHHIERLMILGNFMLLCEIDPEDVYEWFMNLFVDAYDWVMVPNVYGMSQFADGGLMSTKPYISSSNYLINMGDFKNGKWQIIWDGLFWRFINKHRNFFLSNNRSKFFIKVFDEMPEDKKRVLLEEAENYLKNLFVNN
ncbi:MAG: cryptochrome/photolyase family protein [Caldisericia bacterium]